MRIYALGILAFAVLVGTYGPACSSNSAAGDACLGEADSGQSLDGGTDTNPDGVPYPTACYGRTARSGDTPGSVIQNFQFLGYPSLTGDGQVPITLSTISLADYYDPCNKRYKMIHLSVASVWCTPCSEETAAIAAAMSQLKSEGVIVLQALVDGPTNGTPATQGDLDTWVKNHNSNFPEMLDPNLVNFAGFFTAAVPWNADLDPRTMEILDSTNGWSGSVSSEINLSVVPAQPSYPIPASANCN